MIAITAYIFQKNSTKASKNQLIKALAFAAIVQIIVMIFPYTPNNIIMFIISYLGIISITNALIFIARYLKK